MFRAVNTESEHERKRIHYERIKIKNVYLSVTKTLNVEKYFEMKIHFEQNKGFYLAGKANLLYNLVRRTQINELDKMLEKYDILESKCAFFEFARKCIENGLFVRAKKLLNIARSKGWWCNDLYDLESLIESKCFSGEKVEKKVRFEDFLK
jgi:hypothetical protein